MSRTEAVQTAPRAPSAGPISAAEAVHLPRPPRVPLPSLLQLLRHRRRQIEFVFGNRRRLGDVFAMSTGEPPVQVMTGLPDDARSLFTAKPELAHSTTGESPLRPIVGPDSVLTAIGDRHMRQRKLLLPHFHGEAIESYAQAIADAIDREIASWPLGTPIPVAPRMQAVTLDVIMAGIFGIEGRARRGTVENRLHRVIRRTSAITTTAPGQLVELMNARNKEPIGFGRPLVRAIERPIEALIDQRRRAEDLPERRDILSMLLQTQTENGEALSDKEVLSELVALVLAGHETTANSLAWAFERIVHNPAAHERLVDAVRSDTASDRVVEQTILETMRSRPVLPLTGRRVNVPWRLGPYAVPAGTGVLISILLVHHREDAYPDPFAFLPERWEGRKPGAYEWLPFGGGTRRCLGASLAMAEQKIVLEAVTRRLDLEAADPAPERALHRNVTMIPARGARVILRSRLS